MASVLKRSTADDAEPLPKRLKSSPSKVVSLESLLSNPSDYLSPPVTGVSESKHIFGDVHDLRYNPGGKILSLTLRSSMGEKAAGTTSLLEVAIDFQGQWTSEAYAAWKDLEGAHMYLHAPGGVVQEQKEGEKGQPLKLIYKAASGRLGCTRNGEKIDRIFNYKTATSKKTEKKRAKGSDGKAKKANDKKDAQAPNHPMPRERELSGGNLATLMDLDPAPAADHSFKGPVTPSHTRPGQHREVALEAPVAGPSTSKKPIQATTSVASIDSTKSRSEATKQITPAGKAKLVERRPGGRYAPQPGDNIEEMSTELVVNAPAVRGPGNTRKYTPLGLLQYPGQTFDAIVIPIRAEIPGFKERSQAYMQTVVLRDPTMLRHGADEGVRTNVWSKTSEQLPPCTKAAVLVLYGVKADKQYKDKPSATQWASESRWAAYINGQGWEYSTSMDQHRLTDAEAQRAMNLLAWDATDRPSRVAPDLVKILDTNAIDGVAKSRVAGPSVPQKVFGSSHVIEMWQLHINPGGVYKGIVVEVVDFYVTHDLNHDRLVVTDYSEHDDLMDLPRSVPGQGGSRAPAGRRTIQIWLFDEARRQFDNFVRGKNPHVLIGKYFMLDHVHFRYGDNGVPMGRLKFEGNTKKLNANHEALKGLLERKAAYLKTEERLAVDNLPPLTICDHLDQPPTYICDIKTAGVEQVGKKAVLRARIVDYYPNMLQDWIFPTCSNENCLERLPPTASKCSRCGNKDLDAKLEGKLLLADEELPGRPRAASEDLRNPHDLDITVDGAGFKFFGIKDRAELEHARKDQKTLRERMEQLALNLPKIKRGAEAADELDQAPLFDVAVEAFATKSGSTCFKIIGTRLNMERMAMDKASSA